MCSSVEEEVMSVLFLSFPAEYECFNIILWDFFKWKCITFITLRVISAESWNQAAPVTLALPIIQHISVLNNTHKHLEVNSC